MQNAFIASTLIIVANIVVIVIVIVVIFGLFIILAHGTETTTKAKSKSKSKVSERRPRVSDGYMALPQCACIKHGHGTAAEWALWAGPLRHFRLSKKIVGIKLCACHRYIYTSY